MRTLVSFLKYLLDQTVSLGYNHLDAVRGLACSNDPEGYAGGNVKFLVGPPIPDRPKVMCQTKRDTPVLQRWGFVGQASSLPTVKTSCAQRKSKKSRNLIDDLTKSIKVKYELSVK